ncbi:MAG: DUF3828 domain-containing protein [Rhizobiales bacterium]|nr:DUF3828 domain-containing protein [Hyphomicrobiales bacterium]
MLRFILAVGLGLVCSAAQAETRPDPVARIVAIYDGYRHAQPGPDLGPIYGDRLQGLLDADRAATPDGEVGTIDWDVFVDGNDVELGAVAAVLVSLDGDNAVVRARFTNHGQPSDLSFDLVFEHGGWRVADIKTERQGVPWSMAKVLADALAALPAGRQ